MRHTSTRTSSESGRVDNSFGFDVKCRMLFFGLRSLLFVNDHLRCGLFKLPPPFWSPAARTSICLSFGQLLLEQLRSCPAASFCLTRKIKIIESRGIHK